jgi:hypothetical protein
MPEGFDPASIDAIGINRDGTWIYATQKEEAPSKEGIINPYLTDAELAELKELLKGTRAAFFDDPSLSYYCNWRTIMANEVTERGNDIGWAVGALKAGHKIARRGWNGRGMWLALSPGNKALAADNFWAGPNRDYANENGGTAEVLPSITMKTATGEILMGWLASQTDLLATDWELAR